ncbi:hypothetical protein CIB95_07300 [Lottiidibacillus patelloidae]|uniref:Uncharacterized protein n=1 Tax=Lottiidibacillus patelloidae TaxID=2670334 RepID=A0A263BUP0_9BACI|nr:hypothetical protein [Lottiidibacillus patelloidae]OZM57262.1 hypothetical protein CIB95_07300 [Lottiidibacillus patelloidae]
MNLEKYILAVITTSCENIKGGAPTFCCENEDEAQKVAADLEAILDGISHRLANGMYIIVKH